MSSQVKKFDKIRIKIFFRFRKFAFLLIFYLIYFKGTDTSSWSYTPLTEVPPYSIFAKLVGANRLQTPATNTTVQFSNWILCESTSYTCGETWMVPPAKDTSMFWPIPPAISGLSLSSLKSTSGSWNVPGIYPTEYLKNTYVVSLVRNFNSINHYHLIYITHFHSFFTFILSIPLLISFNLIIII